MHKPRRGCLSATSPVRLQISAQKHNMPVARSFRNRGALFWGAYSKDPTNLGYCIYRVPYFRKLPYLAAWLAERESREETGRPCWEFARNSPHLPASHKKANHEAVIRPNLRPVRVKSAWRIGRTGGGHSSCSITGFQDSSVVFRNRFLGLWEPWVVQ